MNRKSIVSAIGGAAAVATILAVMPASASATAAVHQAAPQALATPAAANIVHLPTAPRVIPTPGMTLNAGQSIVLTVAGKTFSGVSIPTAATGAVVSVSTFGSTTNGALKVWTTGAGEPGPGTVPITKGAEPTALGFIGFDDQGRITVKATVKTKFVLGLQSYEVPPVAPKATTFGVGQVWINTKFGNTQWAQYETAELGAPGGDQASGSFRFSCTLAGGCDLSLKAFSTADGSTVYPRIILEKESNDNGAKFTCEYADGADNNNSTFALTSTATTVPMGIGGTADCGGTQADFTGGPVTSINVPGEAGQGIHYDAFVTLTFAKSGS